MQKIDKLCSEAQLMVTGFPMLKTVSETHRNFQSVEQMKQDMESFDDRCHAVEGLLRKDDDDAEMMPNLLACHYEISRLRDVRDDALEQIRTAGDQSALHTLEELFARLEEVINWFDGHIGTICLNLISLVQQGNTGLVVRMAVIVEQEQRNDKKAKAFKEVQTEFKQTATRFKSITRGQKELRGYKAKFLDCIRAHAAERFLEVEQSFNEQPDHLEKSLKWFFNELNTVKLGVVRVVPKRWKILRTYTKIYHQQMHDFLIRQIDNPDLKPPMMLAIIHWIDKYYAKMKKLGVAEFILDPHVIDNRETSLVSEWRSLIIKFLRQWIDQILAADRRDFLERFTNQDKTAIECDEYGCFRTRNLVDMWRMLREQTLAAGESDRTDVCEGVMDEMLRVLRTRIDKWFEMVNSEVRVFVDKHAMPEGQEMIYDWLVAVANDQIACIDDRDDETPAPLSPRSGSEVGPATNAGYLLRFKKDMEPLVSPAYCVTANAAIDVLRDAYVDLATYCVQQFVQLIIACDFRSVLVEIFTPAWYNTAGMSRMCITFGDYLKDYAEVVHRALIDILIEDMADSLLVAYLSCVKNNKTKGMIKGHDPWEEKLKEDVIAVFQFFEKHTVGGGPDSLPGRPGGEEQFAAIKDKWRVVDSATRLWKCRKDDITSEYENFREIYWDAEMPWVEALLKCRDDHDRNMLSSVKAKSAEMTVRLSDRKGMETIMSKVR